MEFEKKIKIRFKEAGIELTDDMFEQFINYYEMLVDYNQHMNLTAITEKNEVFEKHFLDSVLPQALIKPNAYICDIGTGAGFPAIPLKIVRPDLKLVLVDSLNKRINFLNDVCERLNLGNVTNLHFRAEDAAQKPDLREKFDYCVARGVAKLNTLSEYCLPFVKNSGQLIAYKANEIEQEVKDAQKAFKVLGECSVDIKKMYLPGTDIKRSFVVITKNKTIDKKYPRNQNKPKTQPI